MMSLYTISIFFLHMRLLDPDPDMAAYSPRIRVNATRGIRVSSKHDISFLYFPFFSLFECILFSLLFPPSPIPSFFSLQRGAYTFSFLLSLFPRIFLSLSFSIFTLLSLYFNFSRYISSSSLFY